MKIIVKRFCLSHNGEIYKAGDVVEIEDTKTANRLVANSGGTLEIYHGDEAEDADGTDNDDGDVGDGGASDDVSDSDSEDGVGGIPAFDPAAAVQTDGEPAKEKSRGKKK
jgi:hypothetical protein